MYLCFLLYPWFDTVWKRRANATRRTSDDDSCNQWWSFVVKLCSMKMTVLSNITVDVYLSVDQFVVFCTRIIDDVIDTRVLACISQAGEFAIYLAIFPFRNHELALAGNTPQYSPVQKSDNKDVENSGECTTMELICRAMNTLGSPLPTVQHWQRYAVTAVLISNLAKK